MDITDQVSRLYNTSPFDVLGRDADDVIKVINYVLEKYSDTEKSGNNVTPAKKQKDNFWDF